MGSFFKKLYAPFSTEIPQQQKEEIDDFVFVEEPSNNNATSMPIPNDLPPSYSEEIQKLRISTDEPFASNSNHISEVSLKSADVDRLNTYDVKDVPFVLNSKLDLNNLADSLYQQIDRVTKSMKISDLNYTDYNFSNERDVLESID